jgi:hypothetical protein
MHILANHKTYHNERELRNEQPKFGISGRSCAILKQVSTGEGKEAHEQKEERKVLQHSAATSRRPSTRLPEALCWRSSNPP